MWYLPLLFLYATIFHNYFLYKVYNASIQKITLIQKLKFMPKITFIQKITLHYYIKKYLLGSGYFLSFITIAMTLFKCQDLNVGKLIKYVLVCQLYLYLQLIIQVLQHLFQILEVHQQQFDRQVQENCFPYSNVLA